MRTETRAYRPRSDWLPRAVSSGFIATVVMTFLFVIAYGLAYVLALVEPPPMAAATDVTAWLRALTSNQVLDVATSALYISATTHLVLGVLWAMVYARLFEPRLPGEAWARGMTFAFVPWILSLLVFLPLVGGGLFGAAIGAGPMPAIGNLILHLGYGLTLGAIYGPLGDIPADDLSRAGATDELAVVVGYEKGAARGILLGAALGTIIGGGAAVVTATQSGPMVYNLPPLAFIPVAMALGATLGGFWGSFEGLARR